MSVKLLKVSTGIYSHLSSNINNLVTSKRKISMINAIDEYTFTIVYLIGEEYGDLSITKDVQPATLEQIELISN